MKNFKILVTLLLVTFSLNVFSQRIPDYNSNQPYVSDFANVLTPAQEQDIQNILLNFEKQTTIEIAVVTENNLQGYSIETYSKRLFDTWGIGKAGKNNGLLLLISPANKKWRTLPGDGIDNVLTNSVCSSIANRNYPPNFKRGDFYSGIRNAVNEFTGKLSSNYTASNQSTYSAPVTPPVQNTYSQPVTPPVQNTYSQPVTPPVQRESVIVKEESSGFWSFILNVFLFILGAGIIFGVIYFIYNYHQNKKEEERVAAEEELKKKQKAEKERELVYSLSEKYQTELEAFPVTVTQLSEIFKASDKELLDNQQLYDKAKTFVQSVDSLEKNTIGLNSSQIQALISQLSGFKQSIIDITNKIKNNPKKLQETRDKIFTSKQKVAGFFSILQNFKEEIKQLTSVYGQAIWAQEFYNGITELNSNLELLDKKFQERLDNESFLRKAEHLSDANNDLQKFENLTERVGSIGPSIIKKKEELKQSESILNLYSFSRIEQLEKLAEDSIKRPNVTPYTLKKHRIFVEQFQNYKLSHQGMNVLEKAKIVSSVAEGFKGIVDLADKDIHNHHEEIKRAERERLAQIEREAKAQRERERKAEREKQEKRERKEREEREERERRNHHNNHSNYHNNHSDDFSTLAAGIALGSALSRDDNDRGSSGGWSSSGNNDSGNSGGWSDSGSFGGGDSGGSSGGDSGGW